VQGSLTLEHVEIHDTRCAAPFSAQTDSALNLTLYDVTAVRNPCDRLDVNGDGQVGLPDPPAFEAALHQCWADTSDPICERVDVDGDGLAGLTDMGEFQTRFERCVGR
jgi:hypothetical protein